LGKNIKFKRNLKKDSTVEYLHIPTLTTPEKNEEIMPLSGKLKK